MQIADGISTVPGFFSPEECSQWIGQSESRGYEAATLATTKGARLQIEIRNNDRVIFDDHELAAHLWRRAAGEVPRVLNGCQAIGLNERFRFYRYDPGQKFAGHIDAPFRRPNGETSQLTFMIYLNSDFDGGETKFDELDVRPQTGMALIFRHDLFHEGSSVTRGRKYVLRTDVMFNPPGRFTGG